EGDERRVSAQQRCAGSLDDGVRAGIGDVEIAGAVEHQVAGRIEAGEKRLLRGGGEDACDGWHFDDGTGVGVASLIEDVEIATRVESDRDWCAEVGANTN